MTITTEAELVGLRTVGRVAATTLHAMARAMQAGIAEVGHRRPLAGIGNASAGAW